MSNQTFTLNDDVVTFFGYISNEDDIRDSKENRNIATAYEYAVKRGAMFSKYALMGDVVALRKARDYKIIADTLGRVLIHAHDSDFIDILKQAIFNEIELDSKDN